MKKLNISFVWQGFSGRYGVWRDGLWAAMQLIGQEHNVRYFEPWDDIPSDTDIVLYWEAPCTINGPFKEHYIKIASLPYKKALLFAGGPLKAIDVKDFDLVFVESQINEEDCEREGIPYKRAFGVNTQIMKPLQNREKYYDAFMQATFASWKRHELFAQAMEYHGAPPSKGVVAGRKQEFDLNGFNECMKRGILVLDEVPAQRVAELINNSHVVLNTAEYWGGGQRCTLEALACGVPVIVMADSPKNVEFLKETPCGSIVEPTAEAIREAVTHWKEMDAKDREFLSLAGVTYIKYKWTEKHYADALLEGIKSII